MCAVAVVAIFLAAALHGSAASKLGISCHECLVVSKVLEHSIIAVERELSASEDRVRKVPVKLSEQQVDQVLDTTCSELALRAGEHAERLSGPCTKLIEAYRTELDSLIIQEGWRYVRQKLCSDWSSACSAHALYDSGEL